MPAGSQLAQSCHACFEFHMKYPDVIKEWHNNSNYIAILAAKDESELISLVRKLESKKIKFAIFRESDLNNEITAIAIEPGPRGKRLTSSFPLALKKYGESC